MRDGYSDDEVHHLGVYQITEVMVAQPIDGDRTTTLEAECVVGHKLGSIVRIPLSGKDIEAIQDAGHRLDASGHIELALLFPEGA